MNEHIKKIKTNRYIGCIYSYGIWNVLMVLDYYEHKENYAECQCIYRAISEVNSLFRNTEKLPTRLPGWWFVNVRESYNKVGYEHISMANINSYIASIIQETKI